jgi:hypothetical protein
MIIKLEVPCHNCICTSICKHKLFDELIRDCKLLVDSLYFDNTTSVGQRSTLYGDKMNMVQDILNPEYWEVLVDSRNSTVNMREGNRDSKYFIEYVTSADYPPNPVVPKRYQIKKTITTKSGSELAYKIRERRREREQS